MLQRRWKWWRPGWPARHERRGSHVFVGGDGGGGTQSVGGAGGSSAGPTGITGTPGSSGTGGNGGASGSSECGGGGGGGGYFGGGGGGGTDCGVLTTSGQGGGGGGGSGFGPGGATFNTGVQTGDGSVTIVATQPALTLSLLNKMQVQPCSNLGCAAATVRAKLQQTDGTPIAGASVTLKVTLTTSAHGTTHPFTPPPPRTTGPDGIASFTFSATSPEGVAVQATAPGPIDWQDPHLESSGHLLQSAYPVTLRVVRSFTGLCTPPGTRTRNLMIKSHLL